MGNHILIIEDDLPILLFVSEALEDEGYEVRVAVNGREALEGIQRNRPSLVLLDMRLPHLDGWGFVRELVRLGVQVPIIVMTAAVNAASWAAEIGAVAYLAKPFTMAQLLAVVERVHRASDE